MKEDDATDYDKSLLKTGIETGRLRDRKWIKLQCTIVDAHLNFNLRYH